MFEEIFRSFKKSSKIKRLTKEYLKYSLTAQTSAFEALSTARVEARSKVFDEVLETAFREPNNQPVIKKFNLDKRKLEDIVEEFIYSGQAPSIRKNIMNAMLEQQTLLQRTASVNRIVEKIEAFIETFTEKLAA